MELPSSLHGLFCKECIQLIKLQEWSCLEALFFLFWASERPFVGAVRAKQDKADQGCQVKNYDFSKAGVGHLGRASSAVQKAGRPRQEATLTLSGYPLYSHPCTCTCISAGFPRIRVRQLCATCTTPYGAVFHTSSEVLPSGRYIGRDSSALGAWTCDWKNIQWHTIVGHRFGTTIGIMALSVAVEGPQKEKQAKGEKV